MDLLRQSEKITVTTGSEQGQPIADLNHSTSQRSSIASAMSSPSGRRECDTQGRSESQREHVIQSQSNGDQKPGSAETKQSDESTFVVKEQSAVSNIQSSQASGRLHANVRPLRKGKEYLRNRDELLKRSKVQPPQNHGNDSARNENVNSEANGQSTKTKKTPSQESTSNVAGSTAAHRRPGNGTAYRPYLSHSPFCG